MRRLLCRSLEAGRSPSRKQFIAFGYPGVVAASVRRARTPEGLADRELIFEHVSALRTAGAYEPASHIERRCEAETTSSKPLKFLSTDPSDGSTKH